MEQDPGRYVEGAHELRLFALLHGLVREHEMKGAADRLGVDVRTLATCLRRRRLSDRVRVALEGQLQAESDRLAQRVGGLAEEVATLGSRVEELAGELHGALDRVRPVVAEEVGALREEQAEAVRGLERRLAQIEGRQGGSKTAGAVKDGAVGAPEAERRQAYRRHPRVVTAEAEYGEEDVYGDAEPLVIAWRNARTVRRAAKGRLEYAEATERQMSLEIALMEGHGLTLAPERDPFDSLTMSSELKWRRLELTAARRERQRALRRRWLRRALTLGLWWE